MMKNNVMYLNAYRLKHILLITLLMLSSQVLQAGQKKDSLRQAILTQEDPIRKQHAMALLAGELTPFQMDSARILLENSAMLSKAIHRPVERSAWLNLAGNFNWYDRNLDSAMVNYLITYGMDHPDISDRRAAAAVNLASLYNSRSKIDSAMLFYDRAIELFDELGDEAGIAHIHYSLGLFHNRRDNYELSLRNFLQSLEYREAQADTFDLMHTHNALASVYLNLDNPHKALEHYLESAAMGEYYSQHRILPSVYSNLANVYLTYLQDDEQGVYWADKALELAMQRNNIEALFTTKVNLGKMHQRKGNLDLALDMITGALEDYRQYMPSEVLVGASNILAGILIDLGRFDAARNELNTAMEAAIALGSLDDLSLSKLLMFRMDSLQGNYLQAIEHYQASRSLHDSIWQKERADRLAELEIIYETEKKEAENVLLKEANALKEEIIANQQRLLVLSIAAISLFILLLVSLYLSRRKLHRKNIELEEMHREVMDQQSQITSQNQLLEKQTRELIQLNKTKDKFFSIIGHDLRGPFTALFGLVDILQEDMDNMDEQEKRDMITDLQITSRRAYDLTINLLEWSKVQRNLLENKPRPVNLEQIIDQSLQMVNFHIKRKEQVVHKDISANETFVDPNLLQSVLSNLIGNAAKFTGVKGEIRITVKQGEKNLWFCVEDNGIGIPDELMGSLFELTDKSSHRKGTQGEDGTGLGLVNAKEFVQLMGGELKVESEVGKGSRFCFTIPTS